LKFFLTGTDTDVGKTITAAALCQAWDLDYYKPVQSGLPADTDTVQSLGVTRTWPEAYRLGTPSSPHTSARRDGVRIDLAKVPMPPAERLLVEGAGGWCVPLAEDPWVMQADLVRKLDLPVILVARTALGTLNHTTLSARQIRADASKLAGLILVGPAHPENEADLPKLTGAPVIARLPQVDLPGGHAELVEVLRAARAAGEQAVRTAG